MENFHQELAERFKCMHDLLVKPSSDILDITAQTQKMEALIDSFKQKQLDASSTTVEDDNNVNHSRFDDEASKKMLEFISTQIEALKQMKTLKREMKIKEDLLNQKFINASVCGKELDISLMALQAETRTLEKELEEKRAIVNGSAISRGTNATKDRIEKLENELDEKRKKVDETKKLAERDRKRINDLRKEIQKLETDRVDLIYQQRS